MTLLVKSTGCLLEGRGWAGAGWFSASLGLKFAVPGSLTLFWPLRALHAGVNASIHAGKTPIHIKTKQKKTKTF